MRNLRPLSIPLAAFAAAALLAACGGGGGTPSIVPPGGNGAPPATSTPGPSTSPTVAPTASPTVAPTATPTTAPTATPAPGSTPGLTGQTIYTHAGAIFGTDNMFTPNDSDTATGGNGQTVDGITCDPVMSNNYHVHAFLGLYVNGQEIAIPDALGMKNNHGEGADGITNYADCFYHIHTHDAGGIIHMEDPDPAGVPTTGSLFTLKNVLDVWGITLSATQFGQFSGPVTVYTSGQMYRGGGNSVDIPRSDYSLYANDPNTVALYSHEVVWVVVGTPPAQLPNVHFYTEF